MIYISRPSLVFSCLSLLAAGTAAAEGREAAREPRAAAVASSIHYQGGRLSARIENRPLIEVLRELGTATGARFILSDPRSGQVSVYVTVESQPFVEGMREILKGLSYVIYSRDGEDLPTVTVLSTGQSAGAPLVRAEPVFTPPPVLLPQAEDQSEADQAEALAREQTEREETLNHAIAALSPAGGGLNQQALDQLVGIRDDPRATQALVQAALGASDSGARARATETLWHHAADLEFADDAAVSALEQLADDADPEVQKTARQAIEDMKQYREHNPSQ